MGIDFWISRVILTIPSCVVSKPMCLICPIGNALIFNGCFHGNARDVIACGNGIGAELLFIKADSTKPQNKRQQAE